MSTVIKLGHFVPDNTHRWETISAEKAAWDKVRFSGKPEEAVSKYVFIDALGQELIQRYGQSANSTTITDNKHTWEIVGEDEIGYEALANTMKQADEWLMAHNSGWNYSQLESGWSQSKYHEVMRNLATGLILRALYERKNGLDYTPYTTDPNNPRYHLMDESYQFINEMELPNFLCIASNEESKPSQRYSIRSLMANIRHLSDIKDNQDGTIEIGEMNIDASLIEHDPDFDISQNLPPIFESAESYWKIATALASIVSSLCLLILSILVVLFLI